MTHTKPVGEKPPDPNGRGGKTGAQDAPPAPNQEDHGHGGPQEHQQQLLRQQELEKPKEQRQQLLLMRTS